jgi:hypothetical protein
MSSQSKADLGTLLIVPVMGLGRALVAYNSAFLPLKRKCVSVIGIKTSCHNATSPLLSASSLGKGNRFCILMIASATPQPLATQVAVSR